MFQVIQTNQIFDLRHAQVSDEHPSYWLAQLRKTEWQHLLINVGIHMAKSAKKSTLVNAALQHYEFKICLKREEVHQVWQSLQAQGQRGLVIQFRHTETDWTRGIPEFVDLHKNQSLGYVNIAARLICKSK